MFEHLLFFVNNSFVYIYNNCPIFPPPSSLLFKIPYIVCREGALFWLLRETIPKYIARKSTMELRYFADPSVNMGWNRFYKTSCRWCLDIQYEKPARQKDAQKVALSKSLWRHVLPIRKLPAFSVNRRPFPKIWFFFEKKMIFSLYEKYLGHVARGFSKDLTLIFRMIPNLIAE